MDNPVTYNETIKNSLLHARNERNDMRKLVMPLILLLLFPLWIIGMVAAASTSCMGRTRWNDNDDRRNLYEGN